ncbi:MAG: hypothetical protein C0490_01920 [Marivirga sp.]|nr:hypothetical protein [Marivirga sp.]
MKLVSIFPGTLEKQITFLLWIFVILLLLSGITAFPIESELAISNEWVEKLYVSNDFANWLRIAYQGVRETNSKYPFISYGTDWLAFAHLVIAVAFIGPLRNPVKNIWVVEFGIISCLAIFPFAFICGSIRGIPVYWQLVDCSFGFFGGILLWICRVKIVQLARPAGKQSFQM